MNISTFFLYFFFIPPCLSQNMKKTKKIKVFLRYYEDQIVIETENESFCIPIQAYPVLNKENLHEIFPRFIEFEETELGEKEIKVKLRAKPK